MYAGVVCISTLFQTFRQSELIERHKAMPCAHIIVLYVLDIDYSLENSCYQAAFPITNEELLDVLELVNSTW